MTCYNCFNEYDGQSCPHCGYDAATAKRYPLALRPGTILGGRYIVGKVLGEGGFGITYVAQDYNTKQLVAIKEHFPSNIVTRTDHLTVNLISEDMSGAYREGKEKFLEEAKTLSQFNGLDNICEIYSYFEENGTAYFAMEYVQGMPLDDYMRRNGRTLGFVEALGLMLPIMDALGHVHEKGIIHRDISPDNIMVRADGSAMLIDFGAARYSMGEKSRSLDVILKHGFVPKEQYTRRGRQGAYTDVYAMAATFYYAITGKVPPEAIDRIDDDELKIPSKLGVRIPQTSEQALLKALAVDFKNRFQSMKDFAGALQPQERIKKEKKKGGVLKLAAALAVVAVAALALMSAVPKGQDVLPEPAVDEVSPEPVVALGEIENLSWKLREDGSFVISGEGSMPDYSFAEPSPWYEHRAEIRSLVIEEGVTAIGDFAFRNCDNLASLSLPESLDEIGKYAFSSCTALKKIEIPEGVTSYGDYAFSNCQALESVSIPGSIKEMGKSAFYDCSTLQKVIFHTGIRTITERSFISCNALTSIEIPEGVTSIGESAFDGCANLSHVSLPESLQSINERAFAYCRSLQDISLPDNLTGIGGHAFTNCEQLEEVIIPGKIEDISSGAFSECYALKTVYIPVSVKNIGSWAFGNCDELDRIYYAGSIEEWQKISVSDDWWNMGRPYVIKYENNICVLQSSAENEEAELRSPEYVRRG